MKDESYGLRLIGHDLLQGNGGVGEGMSLQRAKDGRRIMWLAHEGPPTNFTGVDVSDPKKPKVVVQTQLPHQRVRSNSLETVGDIMAVAHQTYEPGDQPAGIELWDISVPEQPKSIAFFDRSGPHSRGVHQVWFVDGEYIHCASGAADFQPRNPSDDQCYRIIDVRDLSKPHEVGRWWLPGTREGDKEAPPPRVYPERKKDAFRAHNTNVYPEKPDRAYVGYLDGGAITLDISDMSNPKMVGRFNPHPPANGFTHTSMPLIDRELLIVSEESVMPAAQDWPKMTWVLDNRVEGNPVPLSTLPLPPVEDYRDRGGRFGSHNIHENRPGPSFRSETLVFSTFFNGGLRGYDISNPYQPKEVATFVPDAPEGSRIPATQINDVHVDENGIVYAVERMAGGIHILELDL